MEASINQFALGNYIVQYSLGDALDRTLLLMRDELIDCVSDVELLHALTSTSVALIADADYLDGDVAQTSYVTAALLLVRSGHRVHLVAPDIPLLGPQPPLKSDTLVSALVEVGRDLLPGIEFEVGRSTKPVDLAIVFGNADGKIAATQYLNATSTNWAGSLSTVSYDDHLKNIHWPFGGMVTAALIAAEAFKISMRKLKRFARDAEIFDITFGTRSTLSFELAPESTPTPTVLGKFDFISAGAIANCTLFALARIPNVSGIARVIDKDMTEVSNLNRNQFLRLSNIGTDKVRVLSDQRTGGLQIVPIAINYDSGSISILEKLAKHVLVGVDHIPSRWEVQAASPEWLGIGATTHWSAMASFHRPGLPCAGCLHPTDDPTAGKIPTVAFVSFWAGLLLATYFLRSIVHEDDSMTGQQYTYLTPLHPENPWRSPIVRREDCPVEATCLRVEK